MEHFIFLLEKLGFEVKQGKHIAVKVPGMKRFKRLDTISEDLCRESLEAMFRYGDARVVGNNKMKLLYGTGNLAKLSAMRNRLEQLDIELIGLNDLRVEGKNVPEVKEDGNTPLENARLKAMVYYEAFQIPVFSCDSGLYFDNVPDEVQPGVHVRNVNGKCLSDDEMIDYYSGLKFC